MRLAQLAAVPKNRILKLVRRYFGPARLAEGELKGCAQNIRCLYVGDDNFQTYLFGLMFKDGPRIIRSWQAFLPRLSEVFSKADFDIGIALIPDQHEPSLRGKYNYRATKNVRQESDISEPWEVLTRLWQNHSETARRIRKAGLQCRISREKAELDRFYKQMFVPHIRKQYGNRAYVDSYEELRQWFERGFLILVEEQSSPVAGGLCAIEGDTLVFYRTGVLEGNYEYVKRGAQAAIYYFMLRHAKQNGLKKVNFLMSHAFVNDGVYKHKAGWGAGVATDEKASHCLLYFLPPGNLEAIAFLENNPVLVSNDEGSLDVLTGWTGSPDDLRTMREGKMKAWGAPGLKRLLIRTSRGTEVVEFPSPSGSDALGLKKTEDTAGSHVP